MGGALPALAVRLQRIARPAPQLRARRVVHAVAHQAQRLGKVPNALGGPAQQRLRVTTTVPIDQPLDVSKQGRVDLGQRLATPARSTHPPRIEPRARLKLGDPLADRVHRDPCRPCRCRDPATPRRARLRRRPQPTLALAQLTRQRPELLSDRILVDHTPKFYSRSPAPPELFINNSLAAD